MNKLNIFLLAAVTAVTFAACVPEEKPVVIEPVFPENLGTIQVNPGDVKTINFSANMDWELELKAEGGSLWFWLEEGSQHVKKIQGQASPKEGSEVDIFVSNVEEYDKVRTCEVILTMGGKSQTIATLTRGSKERNIKVWKAKTDNNSFSYPVGEDANTKYVYEDEPLASNGASVTLVWPDEADFYQMPFMVEADFEWDLAELPDWVEILNLSQNKEDRNGKVEFRIHADVEKITLKQQECALSFIGGETILATFNLVLPSAENVVKSDFPQEMNFSAEGKINLMEMEQTEINKSILSAEGLQIFTSDWMDFTPVSGSEWDNSNPAKLQEVLYTLKVKENTQTSSRTGYIVAIPASAIPSGFNPDQDLYEGNEGEIKEAYKQYIISTVTQSGAEEVIEDFFSVSQIEGDVTFGKITEEDALYAQLYAASGCKNLYRLTYYDNDETNYVSLEYKKQFGGFTYQSMDCSYYPNDEFLMVILGESVAIAPDSRYCKSERLEALLCFWPMDGSDAPLAVIHAVYDSNAEMPAPFSFVEPDKVQGATLEKFTGNPYNYGIYGVPANKIYLLTYTDDNPQNAKINCPGAPMYDCAYGNDSGSSTYWLTHEMLSANTMLVKMTSSGEYDYFLFGNNNFISGALLCTKVSAN